MLNIDTDMSEFAQGIAAYRDALKSGLIDVGREMNTEGQALVRQAMDLLIYSKAQRGRYVRTRKLRGSVSGGVETEPTGFSVFLEALGGAGGRSYASFVDVGTLGSRMERDRLLADARRDSGFNPRAYPQGESGLEARAFMEAAIAEVERQAEDRLFEAQERTWG